MSGWTKLFGSITESSIWCESDKTLRVWVAFLARANAYGIIEGSIPGMAHLCRMGIEDFQECIKILESPDQYSRNPDNEGRRLEAIPGGWKILNYELFRERPQEKIGSRAEYFRKYRSNKTQQVAQQQKVSRYTDIDIDIEADIKNKNIMCDFLQFWTLYPSRNGQKRGKKKASQEWITIKPSQELLKKILSSLTAQNENYQDCKKNGKFTPEFPDPERWLKNKRWEDEITKTYTKWNPEPKKETNKTFPNCLKCGKETTQEDIKKFESCPACYKPLSPEKLKELLHGIGKDVK